MKAPVIAGVLLLVLSTAAPAQRRGSNLEGLDSAQRIDEMRTARARASLEESERSETNAWRIALANTKKLKEKLAEAWQSLGLSPAAAKEIAEAYKPELAARMHHQSMQGVSAKDAAAMMQTALVDKDFLKANQLLIDYQRAQLNLDSTFQATGDAHR